MRLLVRASNLAAYDNDGSYFPANTIRRAKSMEGDGALFQDYYWYEEYIHRRGTFLGNLPENAGKGNICWKVRKYEADLIFETEQDMLDVSEVRRRELAHEFDILTPLPTTSNTRTIDDFKTCPPVDRDESAVQNDDDGEQSLAVKTPGGDLTDSPLATSPIESDQLGALQATASQNNTFRPQIPTGHYPQRNIDLDRALMPPPPTASLHDFHQLSIPAGTYPPSNSDQERMLMPPPPTVPVQDERVPHLTSHPQEPSKEVLWSGNAPLMTAIPQKTFIVAPGVSSMAHYGIAPSIKFPNNVSVPELDEKQSAAPSIAATATNAAPSPNLQSRLSLNASLSKSPQDSVVPSEIDERASKRHKSTRVAAKANKLASTASFAETTKDVDDTKSVTTETSSTTAPNAPRSSIRRLESIISGKALPRTKKEATDAAEELHIRLLDAHLKVTGKTINHNASSKRKSVRIKNYNPDLMPHYFSEANFEAGQEEDSVRCICGTVDYDKSDERRMFACDACSVWQHFACVLPKLGMDELTNEAFDSQGFENKKLHCTVCDPWGNREVLQKLRTKHWTGELKGKDQSEMEGVAQTEAAAEAPVKSKAKAKNEK